MTSKYLYLYNTFTKNLNQVKLAGKQIGSHNNNNQIIKGNFYICGPTVYSDSHIGHAITYIRSDLFRRFMRSYFNVQLRTVMNVTDIDDKILEKARQEHRSELPTTNPSSHPFKKVAEKYFNSFQADMESIRVKPPDLYVKISENINLISAFIRRLEENGKAYRTPDGDINFNVKSVRNYIGRKDPRKDVNKSDFVLWKSQKPDEPVWLHESSDGQKVPGRPGWHVQCSAISSSVFGKKLDFHFGGKDLIFPHHYNEEACCAAYHSLDTSESLHVWADNWLHSGHLVVEETKMSKSLGNVMSITSFTDRSSVNALRLLCISTHYRTDVTLSDHLYDELRALDHKLKAFHSFLCDKLSNITNLLTLDELEQSNSTNIETVILKTHENIIDGLCQDFHLENSLDEILNLSKFLYANADSLRPLHIISAHHLFDTWTESCGLQYGNRNTASKDDTLGKAATEFRQVVRSWILSELKERSAEDRLRLQTLLDQCDKFRSTLDDLGFVLRDGKTK